MLLDNDMATNIVRWVKTKLNGYKPFTVMPNELSDGRLSDTELLLKPSTFVSEESFACDSPHQDHQPQDRQCPHQRFAQCRPSSPAEERIKSSFTPAKRQLNLEELECDVSIEGCNPDQTLSQRQEFSFTLYDLDGHGKITKDDIAGLVKTIYETLGQSIKVPHYGSKTIKVKLTVSPEKKKSCKNTRDEGTTTLPTVSSSSNKTPPREVSGCSPNNNKWNSDIHSSKTKERRYRQEQKFRRRRHSISSSGLSEDREADVSDDEEEVPLNNKIHNPALINTGSTIFSKYKKRSSSLQRQELLQIIQANMEKNNLCFQTSRKPSSNGVLIGQRTKMQQPFTKHFVNSWESPVLPEKCGNMFLNSFDVKNDGGDGGGAKRVHQRSHSYDLPNNRFAKSEEKKKQPTSHELKHRYREFEQARAKEQVVRWLEQEFFSPPKYCNNRKNNNLNNCKTTSKEDVKSKSRSGSNEKQHHHHIHKHVHHHYHHYHESPIVV